MYVYVVVGWFWHVFEGNIGILASLMARIGWDLYFIS